MDILCIGTNPIVNNYYALVLKKKYNYDVRSITPNKITSPEIQNSKAIILTKFLDNNQLKSIFEKLKINKFSKNIYSDNDLVQKSIRFPFLNLENIVINKKDKKEQPWFSLPFEVLKVFKTMPCEISTKNGIIYETLFIRGSKSSITMKNPPKDVFIRRKNLDIFITKYSEEVNKIKKKLKRESNQGVIFNTSFENFQKMRIKKEDISQIEELIDEIVYDVSLSKKELLNILTKILNSESFITAHSLNFSYILGKALKDSSPELLKKFILAAIFHDFKLENLNDINELHEKRTDVFDNHCVEVIALLSKLDFCDSIFTELILNHHEKPDGSGLFKKGSFDISYNCAVFNIAHYISLQINILNIETIKDNLVRDYNTGVYRKALDNFVFLWN